MTSFELLNPKVQKAIYSMKWQEFRPIQDEAIEHIISSPSDILISAPTAGGKTEAAFLPIISQIANSSSDCVKILYISPLKALINDQFERVTALCQFMKLPITKWHGDANLKAKADLIKNPSGIVLITPESIEALFVNKPEQLKPLFGNLEYIVIDEIHSFIETPRGGHLRSLINRLEHQLEIKPIKIALSATINNIEDISRWLNPKNPKSVKIIKDTDYSKETRGIIKVYNASNEKEEFSEREIELYKIGHKEKNLVFANSKEMLEEHCDTMISIAKSNKAKENFLIHHGSLSKEIRENTEKALKNSDNITVFCTNTLELGIDIGNIDRVIFLAPPFSVSSMIQRLGRSGRKENSVKEFRFLLEEENLENNYDINSCLRTKLVKSIAIVELLLVNWSEPLDVDKFDYSTFIHQILSYLAQTGGDNPANIYNIIGNIGFNRFFSKDDFIDILEELNKKKIIQQNPSGLVSLAKEGEKVSENYHFYAAFKSTEEWKIIASGKEIGTLPENIVIYFQEGDCILFAGKRWQIEGMKDNLKTIIVKPTDNKNAINFDGGSQNIHKEIHKKMKEIYENRFIPPYISKNTIPFLEEGFDNYELLVKSENSSILEVLEGSKIQLTIEILLRHLKISIRPLEVGFSFGIERDTLFQQLQGISFSKLNWDNILEGIPRNRKLRRKFDNLLSTKILNKSFIMSELDIDGAREFLLNSKIIKE